MPFIAEPTVVADVAVVVSEEDVRVAVFIDAASAVISAAAWRVEHHCIFIGVFFEDRHGEWLASCICPSGIGGVHLHVVSVVAIFGVTATLVAGMVNVRTGDGIALAIFEPRVPGIHGVGILRLRFGDEDGNGIREGAAVVGRELVNPIGLVGAMTEEEVDVAVIHFDKLRVGAEGRDVIDFFPLADVVRFFGNDMRLLAAAGGTLDVVAETDFTRASVSAEGKVDVTFGVNDHGGSAVVIDFVVTVLCVLLLPHEVDTCFEWAGP